MGSGTVGSGLAELSVLPLRGSGNGGGWTWSDRLLTIAGALWAIVISYALFQAYGVGESTEAWRLAAALTGQDIRPRNSLNIGATVISALRLALYAKVPLLAYCTCRGREKAWTVMKAIVLVAGVATDYAIFAKFFRIEYVPWEKKHHYIGWATGPFPNRNTFATFLAIGLAANFALWAREHRREVPSEIEGRERLRVKLEFLSKRGILIALPGLVMFEAGLMTGSRAGLAAIALAVGMTAVLIVARWSSKRALPIGTTMGGFAVIAIILMALAGQGRGVSVEGYVEQRLEIFQNANRIAAERPMRGIGLGAFPEAMHALKSTELTNDWRRAHNSYLEAVAELGWPVVILMCIAVTLLFVAAFRGVWTRRRLTPIHTAAVSGFIAAAAQSDRT
jgi:O-antigen ligase